MVKNNKKSAEKNTKKSDIQKILDEELEKESFVDVCKNGFNLFLTSSVYGASRTLITSYLQQKKTNLSEISVNALSDGLDFTTYQFYKNLAKITIDPKLETRKPYILIPAISALSIAASLTNYFIQKKVTPKETKQTNEPEEDNFTNIAMASISTTGFNVASHYVSKRLSKPKSIVDQYLNSTYSIIAGNVCGTLLLTPYLTLKFGNHPLSSLLGCVFTVPLVFVDNAIYYAVKGLTEPLYLKIDHKVK